MEENTRRNLIVRIYFLKALGFAADVIWENDKNAIDSHETKPALKKFNYIETPDNQILIAIGP